LPCGSRLETARVESDESLPIPFFPLRFFLDFPVVRVGGTAGIKVSGGRGRVETTETVRVPRIALFALRANGESADKVSRHSEIFFTIGTNGDRAARRGEGERERERERESGCEGIPFELGKVSRSFPKDECREGNGEAGTQYTRVEVFIASFSLSFSINLASQVSAATLALAGHERNERERQLTSRLSRFRHIARSWPQVGRDKIPCICTTQRQIRRQA